jgi:hypothetical protein
MSRFLGILLMLATGSVLVELIAAAGLDSTATGTALGSAFLLIGFLLGVLATARQWLWAILGAAGLILAQFVSGRVRFPLPTHDEPRVLILLAVPPLALMLGAFIGTRTLERRAQARIKPEHDD